MAGSGRQDGHGALNIARLLWNWKTATLSVAMRTPIFLGAAAASGPRRAVAAAATDAAFRAVVAGFCGAFTQRLSAVKSRKLATLTVLVFVPLMSHAAEALVHSRAGTPHLSAALAVSVGVTIVSSVFDLYAMRRGVFIVGDQSRRLADDLLSVPRLLLTMWLTVLRACRRSRQG